MKSTLWLGVLGALVFALGCSSSSGGSSGSSSPPTAEEQSAFDDGMSAQTSTAQMLAVADNIFRFDPDLSPDGTADQNATALKTRATQSLGGCGSVSLAQGVLTVDFGSGCVLNGGAGPTVSGALSASVTLAEPRTISVALTFTKLVVNSKDLDGAVSFVTKNGSTFTVTATNLTSGGQTLGMNLTVAGQVGKAQVDGTVSVVKAGGTAGATTSLTLTGVIVAPAQCYASAGTVAISSPTIKATATFSSDTPTTGYVMVLFDGAPKPIPWPLPPYGSCGPAARDAGAG